MVELSLTGALERSRELGFLGPGEIGPQVTHARAWLEVLRPGVRVMDLGSGGGLPGLVLAVERQDLELTLLDSQARRCQFLSEMLVLLGRPQVAVLCGRAETLGHDPGLRASFDVVVARSFGAPPVTAECAAGFLRVGGSLWVSEPPDADPEQRWPNPGLLQLGLERGARVGVAVHLQELRASSLCPEPFPRGDGRPSKRPLF